MRSLFRAGRRRAGPLSVVALLAMCAADARLHAQTTTFEGKSGEELYGAACAACHGRDGKGQPRTVVGFDTPIPDFTDCSFATPEPDADWLAIAHDGGTVRAFDRRMPAFGGALSEGALVRVIEYLRGFCQDRAWPRGELNLPRPLVTEKAFPENETVVTTSLARGDAAAIETKGVYERRLGARSQFELAVPLDARKDAAARWQRGLGDIAVAFKHALFHSLGSGTILSVAAEAALPTGKSADGLGQGTVVVEPFLAAGQIIGTDGFLQVQSGLELPFDDQKAEREAFVRTAVGRTFTQGRFGRSWSPMIEICAVRELADQEGFQWDVIPQVQVSLSRRQHVMVSGGLQIPVNERGARGTRVLAYLLWDWFDGGFFDGWRP
jgi:mono/diheme cytochrome c family protein